MITTNNTPNSFKQKIQNKFAVFKRGSSAYVPAVDLKKSNIAPIIAPKTSGAVVGVALHDNVEITTGSDESGDTMIPTNDLSKSGTYKTTLLVKLNPQYNLTQDINLRGYSFEYICKILLRRIQKNNFIFQLNQFTDTNELLTKYRLKMDKFPLIAKSKICGDLIEFVLNSTDERLVEDIIIYDVKVSNLFNAPIEVCHSNHIYYSTTAQISDVRVCIVNVLLQPDWNFTLSFSKYGTRPVTVYSRANSKKTIVFNKNIRYGAPAVKRS